MIYDGTAHDVHKHRWTTRVGNRVVSSFDVSNRVSSVVVAARPSYLVVYDGTAGGHIYPPTTLHTNVVNLW